jgi:hypothetical protein
LHQNETPEIKTRGRSQNRRITFKVFRKVTTCMLQVFSLFNPYVSTLLPLCPLMLRRCPIPRLRLFRFIQQLCPVENCISVMKISNCLNTRCLAEKESTQSILLWLWLGIIRSSLPPAFRQFPILSTRDVVDFGACCNSTYNSDESDGEVSQDVCCYCWRCGHCFWE